MIFSPTVQWFTGAWRPWIRAAWVAVLLALVFTSASDVAGTIFDDDWMPPIPRKPVKPPETLPPVPPTGTTQPVPEAPVSIVGGALSQVTAPAVKRLPIPMKQDQAKIRKEFKTVFASELADHSIAARRALSAKLLEVAKQPDSNDIERFVLLTGAVDASKEAADLRGCFLAADTLQLAYDVDGQQIKLDAVLKSPLKADTFAATAMNVEAALECVDELMRAGDFDAAAHLLASLKPLAAADATLAALSQSYADALEPNRAAATLAAKQRDVLRGALDDPAANAAVGRYVAFVQNDWVKGLPMLAKGSDANLKKLALEEQAGPADVVSLLELAAGWAALASKERSPARASLASHALKLNHDALDRGPSAFQRVAIQKRMDEMSALLQPKLVNLLPIALIAAEREPAWKVERGLVMGLAGRGTRLSLHYKPPEEYDFAIEYVRTSGEDDIMQFGIKGDRHFAWTHGIKKEGICWFGPIDGKWPPTVSSKKLGNLQNGVMHRSVLRIRNDGMSAYLDGKLVNAWKTNYADMDLLNVDSLKSADGWMLGIGCYDSAVSFSGISVVEFRGTGQVTSEGESGTQK
jgi:hypothetical protein